MNPHIQRAHLLLSQGRFDLAEKEIGLAVADDPDDAHGHALLAICLSRTGKPAEGAQAARRAIALVPDMAFAHFALASARARQHRWRDAEAAIEEAISLNPTDANYHVVLAEIRLNLGDWPGALASAERGLANDPHHAGCLNTRALALTKLGRADEAARTVEGVLADNPEDPYSHCTRGWTALHQSDPRKALEHFREALRLEPGMDWARQGMVLALKARYWPYRILLQFFLWMSRLGRRYQWAIVIGIFVSQQVAGNVAQNSPELAPIAWPVFYILLGFGLLTWLADPLFNLSLRFNRYGRHAVAKDDRACALWVGGILLAALGILIYGLAADLLVLELAAFGCVLLAVGTCAVYRFSAGWPRRIAAAFTILLAGANASGLWHVHQGMLAADEADRTARLVPIQPDPNDPLAKTGRPKFRLEPGPEPLARMNEHLDEGRSRFQLFAYGLLGLMIVSQVRASWRM